MVKANFFKAIGAGILLYRALTYIGGQRRLYNTSEIQVNRLIVNRITMDGVEFSLDTTLNNISGGNLRIARINVEVFLEGIKIGNAVSDQLITISPNKATDINFDIVTRFKDLGNLSSKFRDLLQDFTNKKVRLLGTMSIETLPNVYKTINIDTTQKVMDFI